MAEVSNSNEKQYEVEVDDDEIARVNNLPPILMESGHKCDVFVDNIPVVSTKN